MNRKTELVIIGIVILCGICIFLQGCSARAWKSEDGMTMNIKGHGDFQFPDGSKASRGTFLPSLPKVEYDN